MSLPPYRVRDACCLRRALAGAVGVQEGDADVEDEDVLVPRDDSVDLDAVDGAGEGGGEVDQGGGSEDDEAQRAAFEAAKAEKEAIKQVRYIRTE